MSEIYITSDHHFFHKNILKYQTSTRPFATEAVNTIKMVEATLKNGKIDDVEETRLKAELVEAQKDLKIGLAEMNEALIERHNEVVKPNDQVYILGDFGFSGPKNLEPILDRMNGKKYFIFGNHDHSMRNKYIEKYFEWMRTYTEIKVDGKNVVLFHFPIHSWNRMHHGAYHFYGHTHGQIPHLYHGRSMDVGVDTNNCYPWNIREIFENFKQIEEAADEDDFHDDPRGREEKR